MRLKCSYNDGELKIMLGLRLRLGLGLGLGLGLTLTLTLTLTRNNLRMLGWIDTKLYAHT